MQSSYFYLGRDWESQKKNYKNYKYTYILCIILHITFYFMFTGYTFMLCCNSLQVQLFLRKARKQNEIVGNLCYSITR